MNYRIFPPDEVPEAVINIPLSKSVSNRALIINRLVPGALSPAIVADCEDSRALSQALSTDSEDINIGGAGTAMRFLTAYFACCKGRNVLLDGDERMRQRPIAPLVDALRMAGARIEYAGEVGFPPLRIEGVELEGGDLEVDASVSSQFVSALLLVAPVMRHGLRLRLVGELVSAQYVDLTLDMMRRAGVDVERDGNMIAVASGQYSSLGDYGEGDWSAASYWYEVAALTSGSLTIMGLERNSAQPDRAVAKIFDSLGVTTAQESENPGAIELMASPDLSPRLVLDLSDTPDIAQTVAVTCAMIGVPFHLSGLSTLKIKETDRIAALASELDKVGVTLDFPTDDSIAWTGRRHPVMKLPQFDTWGDHRMAMSLAPASVFIPGIVVRDAEVVGKSYPDYWRHLASVGFRIIDASVSAEEIEESGLEAYDLFNTERDK